MLLTLFRVLPALDQLGETRLNSRGRQTVGVMLMFALSLVGWAIFRSKDMAELGRWFTAFGNWSASATVDWVKPFGWWLAHAGPLLLLQAATWKSRDEVEFAHFSWPFRGLIYTLLFLLAASSAVNDIEFICFQF